MLQTYCWQGRNWIYCTSAVSEDVCSNGDEFPMPFPLWMGETRLCTFQEKHFPFELKIKQWVRRIDSQRYSKLQPPKILHKEQFHVVRVLDILGISALVPF